MEALEREVKCLDPEADYPFCSEESFERKLRRHRRLQSTLSDRICEEIEIVQLETEEFHAAIERASLTRKQQATFQKYLQGYTLEEIGRQLGITKQAVAKNLRLALKKVRLAWEQNPYRGLAEVYRQEVQRSCGLIGRRIGR